MKSVNWLVLTLVGGAACGGGSSAVTGNSVNGKINGMSMNATSGAFVSVDSNGDTTAWLASASPDACMQARSMSVVHSSQYLEINLFDWDATSMMALPASTPGTYMVAPVGMSGLHAGALYWLLDSTCSLAGTFTAGATAGSVDLMSVSNTNLTGTFSFTLSTGDHISGSFDVPNCSALDNWFSVLGSGAGACK